MKRIEGEAGMDIPQVFHKRMPGECLNAIHICWLPPNSPFGNLGPKIHWIEHRTEELNRQTREAFLFWQECQDTSKLIEMPKINLLERHKFACDYVTFQMRRIADELVGLHSVMSYFEENHSFPSKVKPDSVGSLLSISKNRMREPFGRHVKVLESLNGIHNAQKHSFVDTDTTLIGVYEPTVNAIELKYNRIKSGVVWYGLSLRDLVVSYDAFYKDARNWLDQCSERISQNL